METRENSRTALTEYFFHPTRIFAEKLAKQRKVDETRRRRNSPRWGASQAFIVSSAKEPKKELKTYAPAPRRANMRNGAERCRTSESRSGFSMICG